MSFNWRDYTSTNYTVLYDTVLVKPIPIEEKLKTSIIIPEGAREEIEIHEGYVVATGPGRHDSNGVFQPVQVKPGDRVGYNGRYGGMPIEVEGEELRHMKPHEILLVYIDDDQEGGS